jgi:hypothetical protein
VILQEKSRSHARLTQSDHQHAFVFEIHRT